MTKTASFYTAETDPRIDKTRVFRNPLTERLDVDCLRLGNALWMRLHDRRFDNLSQFKRPIGKLKHEILFQWLVFLLPLVIAAIGFYAASHVQPFADNFWKSIAGSLALVYGLGYLLDHHLQKRITTKLAAEQKSDAGVYALVRELSHRLNMRPETLTRDELFHLQKDYLEIKLTSLMHYDQVTREELFAIMDFYDAANGRAMLPMKDDWDGMKRLARPVEAPARAKATGTATGAIAAALADGDDYVETHADDDSSSNPVHWPDEFEWEASRPSTPSCGFGMVNPASGLPMVDGAMFDVGGNAFGTNHSDPHQY